MSRSVRQGPGLFFAAQCLGQGLAHRRHSDKIGCLNLRYGYKVIFSSYSHSSLLCTFNWSEPTSPTVCMACPSSPQTLCVACPSVGPTALRLLCFPTVRTRPACLACPPRPQGSFHERTKDCSLGSRGRPLPLTTERGQRAVSEAARPFQ